VKSAPIILAAVAGLNLLAIAAATQQPPRPLAIEQFKGSGTRLTVSSRSFSPNGTLPLKYADYGEKISPDLAWSGVPASAKSVVLMVEDPDAQEPKPFVHWVLYNLPPSTASLPEAVPGTPRLPEFGGALQGRNSRGTTGYFGPHPPKGDPPHHYHFEIFAADGMLSLDPGAAPAAVLAALKGHVVASGEVIGLFQAP
jgi:Raf kinase inhibitor-like YbhB/YbcL family protein